MKTSKDKTRPQSPEHESAVALSTSLRELREEQRLTQAELAGLASVTVETIARLERVVRDRSSANSNPSLATLVRIAQALGCGLDRLLGINIDTKVPTKGAHMAWRNMEAERLEREAARLRGSPSAR